MKFSEKDLSYLSGKEFSNNYNMLLENNCLYGREEKLLQIVKNKSVIHIGCCDHIPLIQKKVSEGHWLHKLLEDHCSDVLGIDNNETSVEYVNASGLVKKNVYCMDITSSDLSNISFSYKEADYVLLGEILEHVDNPVDFLKSMKNNLAKWGFHGKYIITVPNAFCFQRTKFYLKGIEGINSDHRYWFTPYTAGKVMYQAGIMPEELFFVGGCNCRSRICNKLLKIIVGTIKKQPSSYKSFRSDTIIVIGE